jgi:hypothetical protein
MPAYDLHLPPIELQVLSDWQWPVPPFAKRHQFVPLPTGPEPCRMETHAGVTVLGEMTRFDLAAARLHFRIDTRGPPLPLEFSKFRRLTLTTPWRLAPNHGPHRSLPPPRLPSAQHERDYIAFLRPGGHFGGRTLGHVREGGGSFIFAPAHGEQGGAQGLLRQFIPDIAVTAIEYAPSADEIARQHWIDNPGALIAALNSQTQARMMRIGQALIELGMLTQGPLDQVLRDQGPERAQPLGEMLMERGLVDYADVQTALAYKMGCPIVDLERFPIDHRAVRHLSPGLMRQHRALALLEQGRRLVVAIDELSRMPALSAVPSLARFELLPAVAPRGQLNLAIEARSQGSDMWAANVHSRF